MGVLDFFKTKENPKIEGTGLSLYKGGRIKVIIINEDRSFLEYMARIKNPYLLDIGKGKYQIIERAILRGKKYPLIVFNYNDIRPYEFIHKTTTFTASDLYTEEQLAKITEEERTLLANLTLDTEAIRSLFNAKILKGIYEGTPLFSLKFVFLGLLVLAAIVLIVLQLSGTVDVLEFFGL